MLSLSYKLNTAMVIRNQSGPCFQMTYKTYQEIFGRQGVVPTSLIIEGSTHNMLELLTNGTIHLRGHHPWCYDSYRII